MANPNSGRQSVRQAARQAAVAAQARRRAKAAERDKRLETSTIRLVVALRERDALEHQAGMTIRAMQAEGLTLDEVVEWTQGETTLKETTRLANLATHPEPPEAS